MKKKGSLSLSVNAIVVIVIAFVVLGLALTFTRSIFKAGMGKLPEAISLTALEAEPSSENPITIADKVEIKRNSKTELKIGYYNGNPDASTSAKLGIWDCLDPDTGTSVYSTDATTLPTITSTAQTVDPSSASAYKVILSENGLTGGKSYICTMIAYTGASIPGSLDSGSIYESKQFFLYVTT